MERLRQIIEWIVQVVRRLAWPMMFLFYPLQAIWDEDATRLHLMLAGAGVVLFFQASVTAVVDVLGESRVGKAIRGALHGTELLVWTVIVAATAFGLYLFAEMSVSAGWVGIVIPVAILIPVFTIIFVMGWHKSAHQWLLKLRRNS